MDPLKKTSKCLYKLCHNLNNVLHRYSIFWSAIRAIISFSFTVPLLGKNIKKEEGKWLVQSLKVRKWQRQDGLKLIFLR